MQLCGKHLIRMEYAPHMKTGRLKTLEESYILDEPNLFPNKVVKQYNKYKPRITSITTKSKHYSEMMCLHYFLNKPVDDCSERIFFTLANNLMRTKGAQDTNDILFKWNKDILTGYLRPHQIESNVSGATKTKQ